MKKLVILLILGLVFLGAYLPKPSQLNPNNYQQFNQRGIGVVSKFPLLDTASVDSLGIMAFLMPGGRFGSCGSCHSLDLGGNPKEIFPAGGRGDLDKWLVSFDPLCITDIPKVNGHKLGKGHSNLLNSGIIGIGGVNEGIDLETLKKWNPHNDSLLHPTFIQGLTAIGAHSIDNLVNISENFHAKRWVLQGYGEANITKEILINSIAVMEQRFHYNTPFQRWLDQETIDLPFERGLVAMERNGCFSCHTGTMMGGNSLGEYFGEAPYLGRFEKTLIATDYNKGVVPDLVNLAEAPGYLHDFSAKTIKGAIRVHPNSSQWDEVPLMAKFIFHALRHKK